MRSSQTGWSLKCGLNCFQQYCTCLHRFCGAIVGQLVSGSEALAHALLAPLRPYLSRCARVHECTIDDLWSDVTWSGCLDHRLPRGSGATSHLCLIPRLSCRKRFSVHVICELLCSFCIAHPFSGIRWRRTILKETFRFLSDVDKNKAKKPIT